MWSNPGPTARLAQLRHASRLTSARAALPPPCPPPAAAAAAALALLLLHRRRKQRRQLEDELALKGAVDEFIALPLGGSGTWVRSACALHTRLLWPGRRRGLRVPFDWQKHAYWLGLFLALLQPPSSGTPFTKSAETADPLTATVGASSASWARAPGTPDGGSAAERQLASGGGTDHVLEFIRTRVS